MSKIQKLAAYLERKAAGPPGPDAHDSQHRDWAYTMSQEATKVFKKKYGDALRSVVIYPKKTERNMDLQS